MNLIVEIWIRIKKRIKEINKVNKKLASYSKITKVSLEAKI